MKHLLLIASGFVFCLSTASVQSAELEFDLKWVGSKDRCTAESPAFKIISAPEGTTRIWFKMIDLDAHSYPHGKGTVKYSGKDIPRGAFKYRGPCPPVGSHRYLWIAVAYDKEGGKVLGKAEVMKPFPP